MIPVRQEELVKALKGFKGLAKQEMLLDNKVTPDPIIRKIHAEARRETYIRLMDLVESSGIENACIFAYNEYLRIPESDQRNNDPKASGHSQAYEMFFEILGILPEKLQEAKIKKLSIDQVLLTNRISHEREYQEHNALI